jgi:hypothetical protein
MAALSENTQQFGFCAKHAIFAARNIETACA